MSFNSKNTSFLKDIRFYIVLAFILRLYGITQPPLEVAHNWRQTTVTMVARNFYETDANIFYPRVDFAGNKTGITGMEFPFLNYLIYLTSKVFGYAHWYGRLINLIISSFGLLYFFKLVRKYFETEVAFNATLVLIVSLWFTYSRKIMPDTFATSFMLAALYYGSNYLDSGAKLKQLFIYLFLVSIAVLSKLPVAYLLVVFIPILINKKIDLNTKIIFTSASAVMLLAPAIWYFYWVPHLVQEFGFWHFFMGKNIAEGTAEIFQNLHLTLAHFYDNALKYVGFAFFLFGLVNAIIKRDKILIVVFTLCFVGFLVIVLKAGFTFAHHSYYIIPFVPVMALVCGYGIAQLKNKKIALLILIAIGVEGILNQQHDFRISKDNLAVLQLETDLDKFSKRTDLILINSGDYPTPMYFAHRKGWVNDNSKIADVNYIAQLKTEGLQYIVIMKKTFGSELTLNYLRVFTNENYSIYKL